MMSSDSAGQAVVSLIILNRNGLESGYLAECLTSVQLQSYESLETIVVDNGSYDGSVEYLRASFPGFIVVENSHNLGFCAGNNTGYPIASGKYILFLNNDTYLDTECVKNLVDAAERYPCAGMLSPKILRPPSIHSDLKIDSAGLMLRDDFTLRDRGFGDQDAGQYDEPEFVFGACGAAAFYRQETLRSIAKGDEVWDERFVAYYEDGDLAWRAHNRGWHCLYWPSAIVYHHRGGTANSRFFAKTDLYKMHTIKNRYLMLAKNSTFLQLFSHLPSLLLREILIWGYLLLHPKLLKQTAKALFKSLQPTIEQRSFHFFRGEVANHALFRTKPMCEKP